MDRRKFLKNSAAVGAVAASQVTIPAWAESDPFVRLDATAQAELIAKGQASALELVDAAIKRIENLNPKLNAVVHTMFDKARAAAQSDLPDGPFKGVPYLIKDLSELKGEPLTFGSKLFAPNVADKDNGSVVRAKEAGLVILGKTNTPEFGLLATTESELLGAAKNPWDLTKHTGGSSGGAGAAVASGMVPFAHASDGGGSIRIPASCCGLVGLKPSRSRLFTNTEPFSESDIGVRLTVSRSVRDTAQMLNVSERKGEDATLDPLGYVEGPSTKRLKIAFSTFNYIGVDADPDVKTAIEATAKLCEELGHQVVEAAPPIDGEAFLDHFMTIWASSPYELVNNAWLIGLMQFRWMTAESGLEPWTRGLADYYAKKEAANPGTVDRAIAYFDELASMYKTFFNDYDVALTPVLRRSPIPLGEQAPGVAFDTLFEKLIDYASYTAQHNAAGTPAMSLPLYTGAQGIPIGSQFATKHGGERTLLELAYELEAAKPWVNRWPTVSAVNI